MMRPRSMSGSSRLAGQPPAQAPNAALPPVPSMPPPPVPTSNTNTSNAAAAKSKDASTSSKASLSEALAQAQVAVQLDMSQDVQGAISAYTTSVDLLQQVMARVQAGIAKDQARSQQQGHTELTADKLDRVRRRQEAKEEENRRLKTIHDTYLERINILLETPQQEAAAPEDSADALGHDYERHPFAYADPAPASHSRAPSTTTSPLDDFHNTPTLQQQQPQPEDSGDEAQIIIAHPRRMSNTAPASVSRFSRDSMAAGDATMTMDTPRPRSGDHQFSRSSQQRYSNSSQTLINPSTQHGSIHQRRRQPSDASSSSFFFSSPPHTPVRHSRHSRSSSLYHRHSQSIEGLPTSSQSPFHTEPSTPTASSSHHSVTTDLSPSQQQSSSIGNPARSNNNANDNYKRDSRSPPPTSNHSISPPPPPPVEKESAGFSFSKSFANRPRSLSQTGRKDSIASTSSAAPQLPALPPSFHLTSSSTASPSSASILDLDTPAAHHADSLAAQQRQPPLSSTSMSSAIVPPYSPAGPAPSSTPIHPSMPPAINRQLFLPVSQVRQPFQFLLRIKQSILHGDYLTHRLYAPKSIWAQAGIKLTSLESKQRMIEMLLIALDGVDRAGEPLLVPRAVDHPRYARASGERLAHELESFDHVVDHIENGLARKLSLSEGPGVKKGGVQGWLPKMARGLDKMANKSNDTPQGYVDGLHRLCEGAQLLDRHLALLQGDVQPTPYPDLAPATRNVLAARLHRQSEFFATVVCRWVLGDVAVLLDKHAKRAGAWSME